LILLCGIRSEPPLQAIGEALAAQGVEPILVDQRQLVFADVDMATRGGDVDGELRMPEARLRLGEVTAVYMRMMDDGLLPEVRHLAADSSVRRRLRRLHDLLIAWMDVTPARVLNRPRAMASNGSKPLQAQLISAAGFRVPETLITNDPGLVLEFRRQHGALVYKSISGVRSIVKLLDDDDLERLGRIRWCPTQFQQHVAGCDIRVHCIGQRLFATEIVSDASDYRYSRRLDGSEPALRPIELSHDLSHRCLELARRLGLEFAGIDLRRTADGEHYCFEVNPSPAFNFYEAATGQPIAAAVAQHLAAAPAASQPRF
jgi:hypothetical protein